MFDKMNLTYAAVKMQYPVISSLSTGATRESLKIPVHTEILPNVIFYDFWVIFGDTLSL